MSKSLWSIVVIGFVTVIMMVVMMLASLTMYKGSPAAQGAKLSNSIRERFGFPEVASSVRDINGDLTLRVEYISPMYSGFNDEKINRELGEVAEFAARTYDGKDRRFIRRMKLQRTEIQGSGCWTRTLERELVVERPFSAPRPEAPGAPGEAREEK